MILGVIGGSGLYELEGLETIREEVLRTPFGDPSGPIVTGRLGDTELAFVARHGRGHRLLPSEINYRANVHALKQLGAQRVVSISAVGSLREGIPPGDLVLVDQFIDRTHRRVSTFFGDGVAGHVSFEDPVCPDLAALVAEAALESGYQPAPPDARRRAASGPGTPAPRLHRGGTYVCMEGPQFSTRAESLLHRSWDADTIGMTAATEAKLCREAELCFVSLALVTDYDCWHEAEAPVTAAAVIAVLMANVARAQDVIRRVLPRVTAAAAAGPRTCACATAAAGAIITAPGAISTPARERLRVLFGSYL